jgi:hypothetical protein
MAHSLMALMGAAKRSPQFPLAATTGIVPMTIYYILSIIAASVISTVVGSGLVPGDTKSKVNSEVVAVQCATLEQLKAQSDMRNTTWRRPL